MTDIFYQEKNQLTPVQLERCTLRRDKQGDRFARMRFAIFLDANLARSSPPAIQAAFEAVGTVDHKIVEVTSALTMDGVGAEFYSLPDKKTPCTLALPSISLIDFAVENRGGQIFLFFSVNLKLEENSKLRHWIVDNVFCDIFAEFTLQQMVLMPNANADQEGKSVQ